MSILETKRMEKRGMAIIVVAADHKVIMQLFAALKRVRDLYSLWTQAMLCI